MTCKEMMILNDFVGKVFKRKKFIKIPDDKEKYTAVVRLVDFIDEWNKVKIELGNTKEEEK